MPLECQISRACELNVLLIKYMLVIKKLLHPVKNIPFVKQFRVALLLLNFEIVFVEIDKKALRFLVAESKIALFFKYMFVKVK